MKRLVALAVVLALAACRGEPVPRDYRNAPPAMTHPPQTQSETPTAHGMPGPAPEPSTGAEGKAAPHKPVTPPPPQTTTIKDTAPATTSS